MEEFFELYDKYQNSMNLYLNIRHMRTGIARWRVGVFIKDGAQGNCHGDAEIVFAEDESRAECFRKAVKKLKERCNEQKAEKESIQEKVWDESKRI